MSAIEQHLFRQALEQLGPETRTANSLTIRPGDDWPDGGHRYDVVLVLGALELEANPGAVVERCRAALRPEGEVIVLATSMPFGLDRQRGFTEASLRGLMCELFPPENVHVVSYGNLLTCLGNAVDAPLDGFTSAELEAIDSEYPTVLVGRALLARKRPRSLDRGGIPARTRPPRRQVGRGVILAYHRVAELRPDTWGLCTSPDRFRAEMELLAERYHPMSLDELARSAPVGDLLAAVAITFDDGYLDNLEVASPILTGLEIPATFFINSAPRQARETWWDTTERILLGDQPVPDRLRLQVGDVPLDLPTRTTGERRSALLTLHGQLLGADPEQVSTSVTELKLWTGLELPVRNSHRLMTAEELVELSRRPGHRIGAHGLNHRRLPGETPDVQAHELGACKAELEDLLGGAVEMLSYPYGASDSMSAEIAEECGFTVACVGSAEPDPVTCDSDPLRLPRIGVGAEDLQGFRVKLEQTLSARA